jgi:FkbM family methyltransferase
MTKLFQFIYIMLRKRIRGFVIQHKFLDNNFGKLLTNFDLILRRSGILNAYLKKGFIEHNNFILFFGEEDKSLISFLLTNNDYEKETREVIEDLVLPGHTFIDLGANIGYFSLIAAKLVGNKGRVFSFEPTPSTLNFLSKNISKNGFSNIVTIEEYAISNISGRVNFTLNQGSECNSISTNQNASNTISAEAITLDQYFMKKKDKRIDFIKIDIEGQELAALQGLEGLNKLNKDLKIIFEFHKENLEDNGMTGMEIFLLLKDYGFNRFTVLFRQPYEVSIPDDFEIIQDQSNRENLNILAEKII